MWPWKLLISDRTRALEIRSIVGLPFLFLFSFQTVSVSKNGKTGMVKVTFFGIPTVCIYTTCKVHSLKIYMCKRNKNSMAVL